MSNVLPFKYACAPKLNWRVRNIQIHLSNEGSNFIGTVSLRAGSHSTVIASIMNADKDITKRLLIKKAKAKRLVMYIYTGNDVGINSHFRKKRVKEKHNFESLLKHEDTCPEKLREIYLGIKIKTDHEHALALNSMFNMNVLI